MYSTDDDTTGRHQHHPSVADSAHALVTTGTRAAVVRSLRRIRWTLLVSVGLLISALFVMSAPNASAAKTVTPQPGWKCWVYVDNVCGWYGPPGSFNQVYYYYTKKTPKPTPTTTPKPTATPKPTPKPTNKPTPTSAPTPAPTQVVTPPEPAPTPKTPTPHGTSSPESDSTIFITPTPVPTPVVVAVAPDDTTLSRPDAPPTSEATAPLPAGQTPSANVPGAPRTSSSPTPVPAVVYGLASKSSSISYSTVLISLLSGFTLGVAAVVLIAGRRRTRRAL